MMFVGERRYTGKETMWCLQQFSLGALVGCCMVCSIF